MQRTGLLGAERQQLVGVPGCQSLLHLQRRLAESFKYLERVHAARVGYVVERRSDRVRESDRVGRGQRREPYPAGFGAQERPVQGTGIHAHETRTNINIERRAQSLVETLQAGDLEDKLAEIPAGKKHVERFRKPL